MSDAKNGRDIGLDIFRIVAFIFVPCVHFFLNSGFYEQPVYGGCMYFMVLLRTLFVLCVPMFLLLTGYLMSERELGIDVKSLASHYKRLIPLCLSYALATVLIVLYRAAFLYEPFTLAGTLRNILSFSQYSWYVEMYLGLSLLIPFLNLICKGIASKNGALCLSAVLAVLTVLPSMLNVFDVKTPSALLKPWSADSFAGIVPDWWSFLYPITYYFFGAYLKRYVNIKALKTGRLALLFMISLLLSGGYNVLYSYSRPFVSGVWQEYGSFQNTLNAILLFLLINSVRYPKMPQAVYNIILYISSLTFTAYICSWITDDLIYSRLSEAVVTPISRFKYFPIAVLFSTVGALILSAAVQAFVNLLTRLLNLSRKRKSEQ